MAFLPLCKAFVTKNDRFLKIKMLFRKDLISVGKLFIVLEDSVSTGRIFVANNLLWLFTWSSQKKKSKQIYILPKTPFLFRNENRRLNNTYLKFILLYI